MSKITAVIDIGSNSARMAIFEKTSHLGFHLLFESKSKVRISQDSYQNHGYLQQAPIKRALAALQSFMSQAKMLKARKIFCVATSAVRDAPNKQIFLQEAKKLGLHIKVINGDMEAYYGALSASNLLPYPSGITIDIGGGSTECAIICNKKITHTLSLNLGTIRLKELFFDRHDYKGAIAFVQKALSTLPPIYRHECVFGIGGTIRALSKTIQKHSQYPLGFLHGFEYDFFEYEDFFERIYTSPQEALLEQGIKEERIDSIQGGTLIFHQLLKTLGAKKVITSGVGVREGVFLHDLLRNSRHQFPPNFNPSIKNLKDRFIKDPQKAKIIKTLALKLFESQKPYELLPPTHKKYLAISAELCNIGEFINFYNQNEHASYIALNGLHYGLTHKEKLLIATLIAHSNKKIPNHLYKERYASLLPESGALEWLVLFLSIAEILSWNPNPKLFGFTLKSTNKGFELHIMHPCLLSLCIEKLQKLAPQIDLSFWFYHE